MGSRLLGDDARIWKMHGEGFPLSRISELVGLSAEHARAVICGEWRQDKLAARDGR